MMSTCILLATCDKYHQIAEFSSILLHKRWKQHPEIFVAGLSFGITGCCLLPLSADTQDWMTIIRDACVELLTKGYSKCYLILDDHPPLAKCNDIHLNKTLPRMMDKLKASVISLYGWGQRGGNREPCGTILDETYYKIERLRSDYQWKFSLHPGLWSLPALVAILEELLRQTVSIKDRHPWRFERGSGGPNFAVAEEIKANSYRICGRKMTASTVRSQLHNFELLSCDVLNYFANKYFGKRGWLKMYNSLAYIYHYYEGPYPIYWQGLTAKGMINKDLEKYLFVHRGDSTLRNFLRLLPNQ